MARRADADLPAGPREEEGQYLRKKWPWNEKEASDFNRRLEELTAIHASVLTELTFGKKYGDNLLNLANIVFNEAGKASRAAKLAVAYAWLNRTGGVVREPNDETEISDYKTLLVRWTGLNDVARMTFLPSFAICLSVARQRLGDGEPAKNDPTRGATHWVSPVSLDPFKNQKQRYARTIGSALNRAFPDWARGNNEPELEKMKKRTQIKPTYAEVTVAGVAPTEFLFYTGVKYKN